MLFKLHLVSIVGYSFACMYKYQTVMLSYSQTVCVVGEVHIHWKHKLNMDLLLFPVGHRPPIVLFYSSNIFIHTSTSLGN